MPRLLRALVVVLLACPAFAAPPPPAPTDWAFDVLHLKSGVVHKGLILDEGEAGVRFRIVRRAPGRPTVWLTCAFGRGEYERLEKLTPEARAELKAKLAEIDPAAEGRRLEKLDLKPAAWLGKENAALRYDSDYFTLVSDAPEEIVRRAADRLENVYAAYARYLPPRRDSGTPTIIHVHQTLDGYRTAQPVGANFRNPAFFEPGANRVVCGTDLQKLGDDLARARVQAKQALDELSKQEAEVRRLYGKKPELERHLLPVAENRGRIRQAGRANEAAFDRATQQLFRVLYHEAFHAYVGSFVFPHAAKDGPPRPGELPRWLNEGMAQVFETAVFEAGELRVGHADRERLTATTDALAGKGLTPIAELLAAGPTAFAVVHGGRRPDSDRAYVTAWAVASYLMFDRHVVGTAALDAFVTAVNAGTDPVRAFESFVGQPAAEFEKALHLWLKRLRPDGSLLEVGKEK